MWRKKHSEQEIREAIYRVGDKEIGIPYRPGHRRRYQAEYRSSQNGS
jgi:hypothetical protein